MSTDASGDAATDVVAPDAPAGLDASPSADDAAVDGALDSGAMDAAPADAVTDAATDTDAASTAPTCPPPARELVLPMDALTDMATGPGVIDATGCAASTPAAEVVHPVTVTERTGIDVVTRSTAIHPVVSVRRACADLASEIACDQPMSGDTVAHARAVLDPGTWYVVLDAAQPGGQNYLTQVHTFDAAPNARCADATPLVPGATLTDQDTSGGGAVARACAPAATPQLFYTVTIPAFTRAVVTATTHAGAASPSINFLDECAATSCLTANGPTSSGATVAVSYDHREATSRVVVVAVSSLSGSAASVFDLGLEFEPLPPYADCTRARALADGDRLTAEDSALGLPRTLGICGGDHGPFLYYSVAVPAGYDVRVTARASDASTYVVFLPVASCDASTCRTDVVTGGDPHGTSVLEYSNRSGAPATVLFAMRGRYDLAADVIAHAPNAVCAAAIPVGAGTRVTAGDIQSGGDGPGRCYGRSGTDRELYYTVSIPPGDRLVATATPTGPEAWSPGLRLAPTCSSDVCLGAVGTTAGTPATLSYTNRGSTPIDTVLAAVGYSNVMGTFDLAIDLVPPPANARCAGATPVASGTTLRGEDVGAGVDDLSRTCQPGFPGPTLYYAVPVPANSAASVTVTVLGGWTVALRVFDDCTLTACDSSELGGGAPLTIGFANPTTADRTMILAVSAGRSGSPQRFDLTVH